MAKFGGSAKNSDILQRVSLCAPLGGRVHPHRQQQNGAFNDILPEGGDVHHAHAVIGADIINAPITAPATLPMPPARLVPPMTQAAMASSSAILPAEGDPAPSRELRISPAMATIRPLMANTASLVRSTLIPDRRAASRLPPMA